MSKPIMKDDGIQ